MDRGFRFWLQNLFYGLDVVNEVEPLTSVVMIAVFFWMEILKILNFGRNAVFCMTLPIGEEEAKRKGNKRIKPF